ncbi:aryl-alcohol dehydrogenase-like predicted oxidoreductase [Kribbella aluminosa]|uniref:Aryl-alcohol dehydrogenase-like predicted oxidoreductase n=1 Tax=Kribbella aluminosa TaxID=416017 RepID=A0ABS4UYF8_9ACTN|nr:aldo/keto reductase [Kribbella aluminosa]MBP2356670.1 aryl-alcohol dehydrogenase-like predicted oxidoreductase [Kribbella aluminosa]
MAVPSRALAPGATVRFRPPRFGLGGSHLGEPDEQTAIATVDAAYQAGIRFFDTSPAYGDSDRRLGTALQRRPRGEFLVSTRVVGDDPEESIRQTSEHLGFAIDLVFTQPRTHEGARHGEQQLAQDRAVRGDEAQSAREGAVRDAPGGGALGALEGAVRDKRGGGAEDVREGVVRGDGAQGARGGVLGGGVRGGERWGMDEGVGWEVFSVLERLRREGVVRAVGVVGGDWEELDQVVRDVEVDCVLLTGHYSLLDQQAKPLLDRCLARGVSVIVAGALVLQPETVQARRITAVCERYGVSLPQAALAFPGRHPAVTSVLITAASPAEIRADAALVRQPVPERLWQDPELARLLSSD